MKLLASVLVGLVLAATAFWFGQETACHQSRSPQDWQAPSFESYERGDVKDLLINDKTGNGG